MKLYREAASVLENYGKKLGSVKTLVFSSSYKVSFDVMSSMYLMLAQCYNVSFDVMSSMYLMLA